MADACGPGQARRTPLIAASLSEQQTRSNLQLPVTVSVQRAGDDSKVGGTDVPTRIREMWRIR